MLSDVFEKKQLKPFIVFLAERAVARSLAVIWLREI